jgi:hypothetical protein
MSVLVAFFHMLGGDRQQPAASKPGPNEPPDERRAHQAEDPKTEEILLLGAPQIECGLACANQEGGQAGWEENQAQGHEVHSKEHPCHRPGVAPHVHPDQNADEDADRQDDPQRSHHQETECRREASQRPQQRPRRSLKSVHSSIV